MATNDMTSDSSSEMLKRLKNKSKLENGGVKDKEDIEIKDEENRSDVNSIKEEITADVKENGLGETEHKPVQESPQTPTENLTVGRNESSSILSDRGQGALGMVNIATDLFLQGLKDRWSPQNTQGIINLATAENLLVRELVHEKLNEALKLTYEPILHSYIEFFGTENTLKTFASFINKFFCSCKEPEKEKEIDTGSILKSILPNNKKDKSLDPNHLVVTAGLTAAYDQIGCAIFNPGDAIMLSAPYYTRLVNDFMERAQVKLYPVETSYKPNPDETGPFDLGLSRLQEAYHKGINDGVKIKALLLINPSNPMGTIMKKTQILEIMEWCKVQSLIVIVSEIYAMSVFDQTANFESILSFRDRIPDPNRTIWLWGLSKDLSLPALRVGVVHTPNPELLAILKRYAEFQPVPMPIQQIAVKLLEDHDWIAEFVKQNAKLLKSNYDLAVSRLVKMGVTVLPAQAGFFLLADFSKAMKGKASWETERKLNVKILKANVLLQPGHIIGASQPGLFRIIFSVQPDALIAGLERLEKILDDPCRVS